MLVVGLHRAGPSASLDKKYFIVLIVRLTNCFVNDYSYYFYVNSIVYEQIVAFHCQNAIYSIVH
jgi:hypothetical protein